MRGSLEPKNLMTSEDRDAEAALLYSIIYNLGKLVHPSLLSEGLRLWLDKFYKDIEISDSEYEREIRDYCNDILDLDVARKMKRIH